jgi:hypothetical protein
MSRCQAMNAQGNQCIRSWPHKESDHSFVSDNPFNNIPKMTDWSQLPPLSQKAYFNMFDNVCGEMMKLTEMKNSDYAESSDAFANFKTIEQITHGRISVESGILVRMTDKLKRIGSLLSRPATVKTEKIEDTVFDLAVYSVILLVYLRSKNVGQTGSNATETSDRG